MDSEDLTESIEFVNSNATNSTIGEEGEKLPFPMNVIMFFWRMLVQMLWTGGIMVVFSVISTYFK